ncbi:MAG: TIGR00730 family Rossman fold protein [Alphaproteobacteria bacterium]|nr:TIGR00730 family Rossman fold protein [Alphaproteobacteria bacterium]
MSEIRNVCVYCGSGPGTDPVYASGATILGRCLAEAGVGLVYGGGSLGLMGITARATLEHNGHVTGIIPDFLIKREMMLEEVQELVVTKNMHERKMEMFERSDAFVALPGGVGTLEELIEMSTWRQLGRHTKPIVLANIAGFWDPLLNLLSHMRSQEFIRANLELHLDVVNRSEDILPTIVARAGS